MGYEKKQIKQSSKKNIKTGHKITQKPNSKAYKNEKNKLLSSKETKEAKKSKKMKKLANPSSRAAARRSVKVRKFRLAFLYSAFIIILITACVYLSLGVLFKIETINVSGLTKYSEEEIINSCGIHKGKNILFCGNGDSIMEKISDQYPYIEKISLKKNIAKNEVTIEITEEKLLAYVQYENKLAIISKDGKIVDITDSVEAPDCAQLCGVKLSKVKVSDKLAFTDENKEKVFYDFLRIAGLQIFEKISKIDLTSLANLEIIYDNRFTIKFGTVESLENKIKRATEVLKDLEKSGNTSGIIDVSTSEVNNRTYFKKTA